MAATNHFLSKHLVNYRPLSEFWTWLASPVVFAVLILGLLFLYAAPGLRLEAGKGSKFWSRLSRVTGLSVIFALMVFLNTSRAFAQQENGSEAFQPTLNISIDMQYSVVKRGDKVEFNTQVTNSTTEGTPALIVAMNIINLSSSGDVVDPEDWSPERTQYIESLAPNQSASQHWIINTILDGDYMVYMVLIPTPEGTEATSQPVASSGIHLTVTPFTRINPGGVLPYVIGGPVVLLLATFFVYRRRRRAIDTGGGGET